MATFKALTLTTHTLLTTPGLYSASQISFWWNADVKDQIITWTCFQHRGFLFEGVGNKSWLEERGCWLVMRSDNPQSAYTRTAYNTWLIPRMTDQCWHVGGETVLRVLTGWWRESGECWKCWQVRVTGYWEYWQVGSKSILDVLTGWWWEGIGSVGRLVVRQC